MSQALHILIIEDEVIAARNLQQILKDYPEPVVVLETLRSVAKAKNWLKDHQEKVDLVLMDIQLTDGISFDIFEEVELRKPIIFTTAFDEYAIRAFKLNSIDYLLKPVLAEELFSALDKWKDMNPAPPRIDYRKLAEEIQLYQPKYKHRFLVKRGASLFSIPTSEIAYFQADGNLVILRTLDNKNYPVNYSLEQLSHELDPEFFFRITRNVLIHFPAIKKVNSYFKGRLSLEVDPPAKETLVISSKKACLLYTSNGSRGIFVSKGIEQELKPLDFNIDVSDLTFSGFQQNISAVDIQANSFQGEHYFWHHFDGIWEGFHVIKPELSQEVLDKFPDLAKDSELYASTLFRKKPGPDIAYDDLVLPANRFFFSFYQSSPAYPYYTKEGEIFLMEAMVIKF